MNDKFYTSVYNDGFTCPFRQSNFADRQIQAG
jgi:hypothetical protein